MPLTLYLPGLLRALGDAAGAHPVTQGRAPALARLLAKADARPERPEEARLMAPLAGAAACGALAHDLGPGPWLRADPVQLSADHRGIYCLGHSSLRLSAEEVAALLHSLNAFLAEDGLALYAPAPHEWYLHGAAPMALVTTPLAEVLGKDIARFLPAGGDARHCQRLATELAMLLHSDPVNAARLARGEPAVTGLWFWGEGALPDAPWRGGALYADDAALRGLALAGGAAAAELPESLGALATPDAAAVHSLVFAQAMAEGDAPAWLAGLARFERDWFAPALAALAQGRLDTLQLLPGNGRAYTLTRSGLRRFWRFARPLEQHLA